MNARLRLIAVGIALLATIVLAGCGVDLADPAAMDGRDGVGDVEASDERAGRPSVEDFLDQLADQDPPADQGAPAPSLEGDGRPVDEYLSVVLEQVDGYWTATLAGTGAPVPDVEAVWPGPGEVVETACGRQGAAGSGAYYCPIDDTIVVSQAFARDLYEGMVRGPRRSNQTLGDFAVAYVVAHEFAHNVQQEAGIFDAGLPTVQTELHADCWAGVWAGAAFRDGLIDDGEIDEAVAAADLLGDYAFDDPDHHGTPDQRADALRRGYRSGDPAGCEIYLQA